MRMLFASLFITAMLAVVSGCGDKPATSTPEVKTPPTEAPGDPAADKDKEM